MKAQAARLSAVVAALIIANLPLAPSMATDKPAAHPTQDGTVVRPVIPSVVANSPAPRAAQSNGFSMKGVKGLIHLQRRIRLSEPAKFALISTESNGAPYASLILTESNKVLTRAGAEKYREVFHPAAPFDKIHVMPDPFGRSLGVTDDGPNGAFYLFDRRGQTLAKVSKLHGYKHVFSEPLRPLIVSRPSGGWAGWPSIWKKDGVRNESMSKGWPEGDAVKAVRFSPGGKAIAVLSNREPSTNEFTLSVFTSTGSLIWRTGTASGQGWSSAEVDYSRSGRLLAAASLTRFRVFDVQGKSLVDLPITARSEQHLCFSDDDNTAALASGGIVSSVDISARSVRWTWEAKQLQDANGLPPGDIHLDRVACSADGQTLMVSGLVWSWETDVTPQGEKTRKMVTHTEFFAILRDGALVDAVTLPPGSLLQDLGESRAGATNISLSPSGREVIVPSPREILFYAFPR